MSLFIKDKLAGKTYILDTGGHWENLMTLLREKYSNFWDLPTPEKDKFILDNFEFGDEDWDDEMNEDWLDAEYVSLFSLGERGYRDGN